MNRSSTLHLPLQTSRLHLRHFLPQDEDDLFSFHSRPDVSRFLYWEPRDRDEVRRVLARKSAETTLVADGDVLALAVVLPEVETGRGTVIGEVSLWLRSVEHRQGEIGFVFNPTYHGRGYATEAATALLTWAFDSLGLHRVYGRADARNRASMALMRRLGMRQEAHLVHNENFKGEWADEVIFAVLGDEWRAKRHG